MPKPDKSVRVPQRDKIKSNLTISTFEWTERQKQIISCILDKNTKIVFLNGPAGTAKTYLSTYCGLQMLSDKRVGEFIYFRTVVESASKGLGYLPGEFCDKFKPFIAPLEEKLDELLPKTQAEGLVKENRIRAIPVNYLRGCSFNATYLFADESQNFTVKELITLLTRIGKFSKLIICGDSMQADLNGSSGFIKIISLFNDEDSRKNGIYCFNLDRVDVVREEVIKFILSRIENLH